MTTDKINGKTKRDVAMLFDGTQSNEFGRRRANKRPLAWWVADEKKEKKRTKWSKRTSSDVRARTRRRSFRIRRLLGCAGTHQ